MTSAVGLVPLALLLLLDPHLLLHLLLDPHLLLHLLLDPHHLLLHLLLLDPHHLLHHLLLLHYGIGAHLHRGCWRGAARGPDSPGQT